MVSRLRAAIHTIARGTAVFCGLMMLAAPAWSQGDPLRQPAGISVDKEQMEAERQQLFQVMLREPANLDVAFRYALLSSRLGDYEGAISTLERMLIFAPGLSRLQLELGVLYYRLGSFETARNYLNAALSGPDVPTEVDERARAYLDEIDERTQIYRFYGNLFSGLRWQSNANSGPASRGITVNGLTFLLDEEATGNSDWSVVNTLWLHGDVDLENQGDRFETDLVVYSARYFDQTEVDLEVVTLNSGFSFNMARFDVEDTRSGIYAIYDWAQLDDSYYFSAVGAGLKLVSHALERKDLTLKGEYRHRQYNDTPRLPTNSLRDGDEGQGIATFGYRVRPDLYTTVEVRVRRQSTDADLYANWEWGGSWGAVYQFRNPFAWDDQVWTLQGGTGLLFRHYDAPDPVIDPTESERDFIYWGRMALVVPVRGDLSVVPQIEYRNHDSNYDIRSFDNFTAMVGMNWSF